MRYPCKKPHPNDAIRKLCRHCRRHLGSSGSSSTSDESSGSRDSSTDTSTGNSSSDLRTSTCSDSSDSQSGSSTYSSDDSSSECASHRRRAEIISESSESVANSPLFCPTGTVPKQQKPPESNS